MKLRLGRYFDAVSRWPCRKSKLVVPSNFLRLAEAGFFFGDVAAFFAKILSVFNQLPVFVGLFFLYLLFC